MPFTKLNIKQTMRRASPWVVMVIVTTAACLYFFQEPFLYYPGGTEFSPSVISVERSKSISVQINRCNRSIDKKEYKVVRRFVRLDKKQDDYLVLASDSTIEGRSGGRDFCDTIMKEYRVPDDLPVGIYHVEGDAIIPGFFRTFFLHFASAPFQVS